MASLDLVHTLLLVGAALVMAGIFSSLVATRFGVPLLLVFLVLGMLAGENGPGGIRFDDYRTTYLVGSLALSVILFDGGLRTKLSVFRGALAPSLLLATVGVVMTAAVVGAAAWGLFRDMAPLEAFLLGGIVASTDAAAVFFLLRSGGLRLEPRVGAVLEIESGTNDPVAVFLTIVLTELVLAGQTMPTWSVLGRLAEQGAIGAALGVLGGFAIVWLLNRVDMPGGLHPLFVVAAALTIYSATALLGGSGLLAVYLAGLVVANRPVRAYPTVVGFHDAATWLCQIVMFLVLGLLVTPTTLWSYAVPGLVIAVVLTFVARPLAVWLCLAPFGFGVKETAFVSWVGLRGAVSIFLAAIPTLAGVPESAVFFNVAFFVVLFSLIAQGATINPLARRLGIALRRTTPSVSRTEIDIPGQVDREMAGYPIVADSLVLGLSRLPPWTRLVMVVRDGEILGPEQAGILKVGDYAYFLTPPDRVPRLDRLLGEAAGMKGRTSAMFGELPINGDANVAEISALYDLEAVADDPAQTVAQFFAAHRHAPPQPGHRLPFGRAMLIARTVEDGNVVRAGLQLEELIESIVAGTAPQRTRLKSMAETAVDKAVTLTERAAGKIRRALGKRPPKT